MAAKNEINLVRVYDAAVKDVWEAWTDPKKAAKWWGPRGFTITTHSKDLRPGGTWNYTMHGPDGVDYPNITTYYEVEKYSRLVYDHGANETQPPLFRVTVTFAESKGKTTMDMTMAFENEERAKEIGKFIKIAGGNSTWDRLGEYLGKEYLGKDLFIINRTFKAPLNVIFDMWTKPEHFSKWLAPVGMEMKYLKSNIAEGETTVFLMSDGAAFTLHSKTKYLEIKNPNRIVYTQQFCDDHGTTTRAPWEPNWPETMLITVTLVEEEPNLTRVTVTTDLVGEVTALELEIFIKERANMTQGWTGSFDKLEEIISKL